MEEAKERADEQEISGGFDWGSTLGLAFQSIGIVYGDIGTSPLYVFAATFGGGGGGGGIRHEDDVLGALCLILYTMTLICLVKYGLVVLYATNDGQGGTFAMYSLLCRYVKVGGFLPSQREGVQEVENCRLKAALENSRFAKYFLSIATILGTCMVIGDGVLTPCISVLSAVGGIKEATGAITQGWVVLISVVILMLLFLFQRFGTGKMGCTFAPIISIWFLSIAGIGMYNWAKYDPSVVKAVNPKYIVDYFRKNGKTAWISLGGIILCVTGVEALFAAVGHFTIRSIRGSIYSVAYPSLTLAYIGQASYLRKHKEDVGNTFYKSIPGSLYWPMLVVATLAAIIASQAMISATFCVIQQSIEKGFFPRVTIVQTSSKHKGQIYIPTVNYALMLLCIIVIASFQDTAKISNAYGMAVVFVMALTSSFLVLIMIIIWKIHASLVILYVVVIGSTELIYLSSVLYKFGQGGYLPLTFAVFLATIMLIYNYVHRKRNTSS